MNFSITHSMLCYQALNWMNVINFNKRFVTVIPFLFDLVGCKCLFCTVIYCRNI